MNGFFQSLHRAMRDKESFRFQVTRDGTQLKVVAQPLLGDDPDDFDDDRNDDAAQVRAALALPLCLQNTPQELDAQFGGKFQFYGEARQPLVDSFSVLMENLKEASKAAKNATKKTHGNPAGASPPPPKPAASATSEKPAEVATPPVSTAAEPAAVGQGSIF